METLLTHGKERDAFSDVQRGARWLLGPPDRAHCGHQMLRELLRRKEAGSRPRRYEDPKFSG